MKTQIFLIPLFSFLFFINAIDAQWTYGIKSGLHNAWQFYGDDFRGNGNGQKIKGFSTTVMIYYSLGKYFEVGVEPGYIRRGAACLPGVYLFDPGFSRDVTLYANYLTAPVFIKAKKSFFKNNLEIFMRGGSGPSWWVNGYRQLDLRWAGGQELQIQDIDFDQEKDLRRLDFGLNAGAGISVHVGPGMLQMSYEYYRGLLDTDKDFTSKNRNAGFALGYMIWL